MDMLDGPTLLGVAAVLASLAKVIEALRRSTCRSETTRAGTAE